MKTIIIGFSTPKKSNILSYLIKKIQGTEYSHVYVKFYSTTYQRNIIYQASGLQVNFVGEKVFNDHCTIIKEFKLDVSDDVYKNMMTFAIDKAGYPYSLKQLFNIITYMTTGKIIETDGREGYVCSELIGEMLKEILNIPISKDLDVLTPKDIYEILMEL